MQFVRRVVGVYISFILQHCNQSDNINDESTHEPALVIDNIYIEDYNSYPTESDGDVSVVNYPREHILENDDDNFSVDSLLHCIRVIIQHQHPDYGSGNCAGIKKAFFKLEGFLKKNASIKSIFRALPAFFCYFSGIFSYISGIF